MNTRKFLHFTYANGFPFLYKKMSSISENEKNYGLLGPYNFREIMKIIWKTNHMSQDIFSFAKQDNYNEKILVRGENIEPYYVFNPRMDDGRSPPAGAVRLHDYAKTFSETTEPFRRTSAYEIIQLKTESANESSVKINTSFYFSSVIFDDINCYPDDESLLTMSCFHLKVIFGAGYVNGGISPDPVNSFSANTVGEFEITLFDRPLRLFFNEHDVYYESPGAAINPYSLDFKMDSGYYAESDFI